MYLKFQTRNANNLAPFIITTLKQQSTPEKYSDNWNLSILSSLLVEIWLTAMTSFFSISCLSLKTFLSLGQEEKPPLPSSSFISRDTLNLNTLSEDIDWPDIVLGDLGMRRNAVAKLYKIFDTFWKYKIITGLFYKRKNYEKNYKITNSRIKNILIRLYLD